MLCKLSAAKQVPSSAACEDLAPLHEMLNKMFSYNLFSSERCHFSLSGLQAVSKGWLMDSQNTSIQMECNVGQGYDVQARGHSWRWWPSWSLCARGFQPAGQPEVLSNKVKTLHVNHVLVDLLYSTMSSVAGQNTPTKNESIGGSTMDACPASTHGTSVKGRRSVYASRAASTL